MFGLGWAKPSKPLFQGFGCIFDDREQSAELNRGRKVIRERNQLPGVERRAKRSQWAARGCEDHVGWVISPIVNHFLVE